jgi:hypothetical protein
MRRTQLTQPLQKLQTPSYRITLPKTTPRTGGIILSEWMDVDMNTKHREINLIRIVHQVQNFLSLSNDQRLISRDFADFLNCKSAFLQVISSVVDSSDSTGAP